MTRVIYMCVTNIDDQLGQGSWVRLNQLINTEVLGHGARIQFSGFGGWLASVQKSVWVFESPNLAAEQALHDSLSLIVRDYRVPILWALLGTRDFIKAAPPIA